MENYRIYCEENERAEVMSILRKYNDVVIDNVNSTVSVLRSKGMTLKASTTTSWKKSTGKYTCTAGKGTNTLTGK